MSTVILMIHIQMMCLQHCTKCNKLDLNQEDWTLKCIEFGQHVFSFFSFFFCLNSIQTMKCPLLDVSVSCGGKLQWDVRKLKAGVCILSQQLPFSGGSLCQIQESVLGTFLFLQLHNPKHYIEPI